MDISEIKDLMAQFDESKLREFSYKTSEYELSFSKNKPVEQISQVAVATPNLEMPTTEEQTIPSEIEQIIPEGELVTSPLVGVAYLASSPESPQFVTVGDHVKKGQTLLIIEAMKVMNEIPAPCDGKVAEILVTNEEVVDFGKNLVRLV